MVTMLAYTAYSWAWYTMDGEKFSVRKAGLLFREGAIYVLLPFALAYGLSSGACVLLLAIYLSAVLHSTLRGGLFGLALSLLYALLYGLLSAEDYALLMGSLLVFALLAGVMLLTRKLDWYALGKSAA